MLFSTVPADWDLHLDHVGINAGGAKEATCIAEQLCAVFGLPERAGQNSTWAGEIFEVVPSGGRGTNGHICLSVRSVEAFLKRLGEWNIAADMTSAKYLPDGRIKNVYLLEEIGGFAFHIKAAT